jgi:small-conductance mechanosensitive channel
MEFSEFVTRLEEVVWLRQAVIVIGSLLLALLVSLVFARLVRVFTRRTETDVDDRVVAALRGPTVWTIILVGLRLAFAEFAAPPTFQVIVRGVVLTVIALMWAVALMRVGHVFLEVVSAQVDKLKWIEPRTLPLFDMVLKVAVVGGFLYFACIAWSVPLTSWLASAGVVGIAVGFAAKDTLSNLFSGIFIVADTPYKIGDYVVLDNRIRGEVLEIGMRSTRLLTRDDIEVTVPNAVIGNAQIINETGGPHEKMRVRVKVEAAYGSDIDQVEEVLLGCVSGVDNICRRPEPRVRFREFGASGLAFELLAWIDEPVFRGRVLHELHGRVYKAFNAAGIEIPYAKQDVYVKEMPVEPARQRSRPSSD